MFDTAVPEFKALRLRSNKGFLQEFITPIVKASKDGEVKQFFTMVEYEKWKKKTKQGAGWKIKYYKGLGTSTSAEAKDYFGKIYDHRIDFRLVHRVVVLCVACVCRIIIP